MKTATIDPYLTDPIRKRILTLGTFGEALHAIKGGSRMQRHGWDKRSYIALVVPNGESTVSVPYIVLKTAEGPRVPWVASQSDLLALDWRTI